MSSKDLAVSVRGLSKSYTIKHNVQNHEMATTALFHRILHPFQKVETETFWALKDVEFEVKKGEVVGIIGRNGAGKSTLLKILSRITEPTTGEIDVYGRVGSLLEVGTGFHPELTGRENVYLNGAILGMTHREIGQHFDAIVDFADIEQFLDTPVKRYSSGMYVRLAFAVAAHLNPEILIVDEVLAVGDAPFQKKCLGKMGDVARQEGRTVLFVSHNMAAVNTLCTSAIVLDRGEICFAGNVDAATRKYALNTPAVAEATVDFVGRTTERYGPREYAQLLRIELLNSHDQPSTILQMGESVAFHLTLNVLRPSDQFEIGITVANLLDVIQHILVSGWEGFNQITTTGEHTVRVELPHVHLFPGDYKLHVWIAIRGRYYDDAVHEVLRFTVVEGRVNEHDTYFERFSRNSQVYTPSRWSLRHTGKLEPMCLGPKEET